MTILRTETVVDIERGGLLDGDVDVGFEREGADAVDVQADDDDAVRRQ